MKRYIRIYTYLRDKFSGMDNSFYDECTRHSLGPAPLNPQTTNYDSHYNVQKKEWEHFDIVEKTWMAWDSPAKADIRMYFDISNTADEDGNENRKNVIKDDSQQVFGLEDTRFVQGYSVYCYIFVFVTLLHSTSIWYITIKYSILEWKMVLDIQLQLPLIFDGKMDYLQIEKDLIPLLAEVRFQKFPTPENGKGGNEEIVLMIAMVMMMVEILIQED